MYNCVARWMIIVLAATQINNRKKLASVYAVMSVTRLAVVIFFLAGIAGKL